MERHSPTRRAFPKRRPRFDLVVLRDKKHAVVDDATRAVLSRVSRDVPWRVLHEAARRGLVRKPCRPSPCPSRSPTCC